MTNASRLLSRKEVFYEIRKILGNVDIFFLMLFLADVVITRNCLSQLEYSRHDIPADKYEGCRPAAKDIQLAHYVNNTIKQLDVARCVLCGF